MSVWDAAPLAGCALLVVVLLLRMHLERRREDRERVKAHERKQAYAESVRQAIDVGSHAKDDSRRLRLLRGGDRWQR